MSSQNKYLIAGVVFFLLAVVAFNYNRNKSSQTAQNNKPENTASTPKTTETTSNTSVLATTSSKTTATLKPKTTTLPKPAPVISASERYLQALDTYKKSGAYIQFYPCQATPGTLTVKKGAKIMFDNRDKKTHSIGANNMKYSISGLNYAISTFNTVGINYVTCDGGGSAQVTVQP